MSRPSRQTVIVAALTGLIAITIAVPVTAVATTALVPVPTAPPPETILATVTVTPPVPTVEVALPPAPTEEATSPEPAPPAEIDPNDPAATDGGPAEDRGARAGASGFPVANDAHELVSYKVVEGDSFFDIAQRFNIAQQRLLKMNPEVSDVGTAIYIGQVINLDCRIGGGC
ncbi:LysM peptidoglycan-binding domain-containing protein [Agromyces seonyuensis]|uniref:LysM peptidoglycan-binding domain-containing protein n=1 Tax=Agromyces seonyuensis TaxID=2662446 RepID=A0A6I4NRX5_9MICO|nr:LysM peptidoglycan-binding domain-containing protein [Agromyces seonyuensis]MWB97176.1 LysM peptidoglycan-binding domain-containing protein [Agromyces seonyuensis]